MGFLSRLSIQSKLPMAMATMVAVNIVLLSSVSYLKSRALVVQSAYEKLDEIGDARAERVARLLTQIDENILDKSSDPAAIQAIKHFTSSYLSLENPEETLKRAYIDENPYPPSDRDKLYGSNENLQYDFVHRRYHPVFSTLKTAMGYYDVFLFDTEGNLVYSVYKEADYATNFLDGEWKDSGLGTAYRQALAAGPEAESVFVDFAPYGPSANAPAAFIARPVFDTDGTRLGVISFQMPSSNLNAAASAQMGETGHSFLVGSDGYMRSDTPLTEINDILVTKETSPAVERGTSGEDGSLEYLGLSGELYHGHFNAIPYHGVAWALITEQSERELLGALPGMIRTQALIGAVFLAAAIVLSFLLSRSVSLPLRHIVTSVGNIAEKKYDIEVQDTDRGDEIGDIAQSLDSFRMVLGNAEAAALDAAFKGAAFEATGGPMILVDLEQKVVGANSAFLRLTTENSSDFAAIKECKTEESLLGLSLVDLGLVPDTIAAKMKDHSTLPIRQKLPVGDSYIGLLVDLVKDKDDKPIGYVVDLKNQTFQMASEVLVHAIDSQQARLETNLSGAIKRANDHFENIIDRSSDALVGENAKSLISSEDPSCDIWGAATQGNATIGRLIVKTKGGDRILDGSFNPVPDQNGDTSGFLVIGVDVTEARKAALAAEEEAKMRADQQSIVVEQLTVGLRSMSDGDLTSLIQTEFAPEYEQLRADFNSAVGKLNSAIGEVIHNATTIHEEADGISSSISELSKRTESQAATLEETAAAMHQLTASVASSAQGAASAADIAAEARLNAQASSGVVKETAEAMAKIEASSNEVTKIISVIDDIAFQTNLLALNAGVEAARAGSAGRGFAVVASEVRALAQRCLEASNEISSLISASGEHVETGVSLVGKTGKELENIANAVLEISDNVGQIAKATSEQSHGLGEINDALSQLDQATQQNAAMSEEASASAQSLSNEAHNLSRMTEVFEIGQNPEHSDAANRQVA